MSYLIPLLILILALICETQYIKESNSARSVYIQHKIRQKYNLILALILFGIAALRHPYTGMDTAQYYAWYKQICATRLPLLDYFNAVIHGIQAGDFTDGLMWELFMKLGSYIIPNAQAWLAFISGVFIFACYRLIKRYSLDPIISWVYIYSIFIFNFVLQGLRQSVAMAIILFSFKYVKERKLLKFLCVIAIAYLFHQSAIIFAVVYPLTKIKSSKLYYVPIFGSVILSYIAPSAIVTSFQNIISDTRFNNYYTFGNSQTLSIMGWVLLLLIFVFCFVFRHNAIEEDGVNEELLTITMVGLVIQAFVGVLSEMFRVSYYFNMFNMVLVANTCTCAKGRNQLLFRYGFIMACIAYALYAGIFEYRFFWQG